jgi:hypothetical protein
MEIDIELLKELSEKLNNSVDEKDIELKKNIDDKIRAIENKRIVEK